MVQESFDNTKSLDFKYILKYKGSILVTKKVLYIYTLKKILSLQSSNFCAGKILRKTTNKWPVI